jgi:hypothetical protein
MATSYPIHSGSRWEPLPEGANGSADPARSIAAAGSVLTERSGPRCAARSAARGPRVIVATIVSALALGGTATGIAVARSTDADPAANATGTTAGVPAGQHQDQASGEDRPRADRPAR